MRSVLELLSTPWVGTVLAIVSIAAAVYFYRKSKSVSRLAYVSDELTVVGGATAAFPNDLEVRFGGVVVPKVTAARLMLWNAGTTTIRGNQIVEADPLRFSVPEGSTILRAVVVKTTRPANAFVVEAVDNRVLVDFDFLDPNDGAAIGIYHSADRRQLKCEGTVRGLPDGPKFLGQSGRHIDRNFRRRLRVPAKLFSLVALVIGVGLFAIGIFYDALTRAYPFLDTKIINQSVLFTTLGGLYVVMPLTILWALRRRHPKALDHTSSSLPKATVEQPAGEAAH